MSQKSYCANLQGAEQAGKLALKLYGTGVVVVTFGNAEAADEHTTLEVNGVEIDSAAPGVTTKQKVHIHVLSSPVAQGEAPPSRDATCHMADVPEMRYTPHGKCTSRDDTRHMADAREMTHTPMCPF